MGVDPLQTRQVVVENLDNLGQRVVLVGGPVDGSAGFVDGVDHGAEVGVHALETLVKLLGHVVRLLALLVGWLQVVGLVLVHLVVVDSLDLRLVIVERGAELLLLVLELLQQ